MKRALTLLVTLACVAMTGEPASAYLKLGTRVGAGTVNLRWQDFPVRYFITNAAGGGVSAAQLRDAVDRAFDSWTSIETASISAEFAGFTQARPNDDDGLTVIGFLNQPDQDRTLGATSFLVDTLSGEIVEAEIYLNSFFSWSVASSAIATSLTLEPSARRSRCASCSTDRSGSARSISATSGLSDSARCRPVSPRSADRPVWPSAPTARTSDSRESSR